MVNTSSSLQRHSVSNINCGLSNKINELITFLHPNFPDVLCLTEHQLKQAQLELTYLDNFCLGTGYCR